MQIKNRIKKCLGAKPFKRRHLSEIQGVVVHRIGPQGTYNGKLWSMRSAEEIAEFFNNFPPIGKMAYHFIVTENGYVEQALPLTYVAPGAINLNPKFVQVGVVGDFRKKGPSAVQGMALNRFTAALCKMLGTMDVRGHMETEGASSDKSKECPGDHINMAGLRANVIDMYDKADTLEGVVV